jgi:hypothetical protein
MLGENNLWERNMDRDMAHTQKIHPELYQMALVENAILPLEPV